MKKFVIEILSDEDINSQDIIDALNEGLDVQHFCVSGKCDGELND